VSTELENYWLNKRSKYATEPWATLPSLFAQAAFPYFEPASKLLELGAGLGQDGIWFAEQGIEVTQTDIAIGEMLSVPEELQVKRERIDLSERLPYGPASFDAVYACLSLHYFDWHRTEQLFDEIYDILRPEGVLAVLLNSVKDPEYGQGRLIEEDYFEIDGIKKRYFDLPSLQKLTQRYRPLLIDDQGTSYKDQAKGVSNLIRFIGKKA